MKKERNKSVLGLLRRFALLNFNLNFYALMFRKDWIKFGPTNWGTHLQ